MNNSFKKMKSNQKINMFGQINLSDLSSTSSEFLLNYNKNKCIKQKGGFCSCNDMFKALKHENVELVLYILKQGGCCFKCADSNSNTILHLLIPFYEQNEQIKSEIDNMLNYDCSDFINAQNSLGQTPILLAVAENLNELAEKMENAGADPSIEDLNGNFVGIKNNQSDEAVTISDIISVNSTEPTQNIYNILNLFIQGQKEQQRKNDELTTLGINDISESVFSNPNDKNLSTEDFMEKIKEKIHNSLSDMNTDSSSSSSSSSSEYLALPDIANSDSTINTDKFIAILNKEGEAPSFAKYSGDDDTDEFIMTLDDKYSKKVPQNTQTKKVSQVKQVAQPQLNTSDATSDVESSVNTQMIKLENETTSDEQPQSTQELKRETSEINTELEKELSDYIDSTTSSEEQPELKKKYSNLFMKNKVGGDNTKSKEMSSSDIDTNTLYGAIKKIQSKYGMNDESEIESEIKSEVQVGGKSNKKQNIMGYRKLNNDFKQVLLSNSTKTNKLTYSDSDYNSLYNDTEYSLKKSKKSKNSNINELSRMMLRQKQMVHEEVLNMIMGLLNKGLLLQSNKPIDASERNAKLVKAYIYRQYSEKNPQMGGLDKIIAIKAMSDNEIVKMVKNMPSLDELEESIKKHMEEKAKNAKSLDVSETTESDTKSESDKPKKSKSKSKK